jgi:formate dehydrogenase maturation protein FdhE
MLAFGSTMDSTYKLSQDAMDCNSGTRILVQNMDLKLDHVETDVAVLKLDVEMIKVVLMEIRGALFAK